MPANADVLILLTMIEFIVINRRPDPNMINAGDSADRERAAKAHVVPNSRVCQLCCSRKARNHLLYKSHQQPMLQEGETCYPISIPIAT